MNIVLEDGDSQMIPGDKYGINLLTKDLQLRRNRGKNLNQEIDQTETQTWARLIGGNDVTPRSQRWSISVCVYTCMRACVSAWVHACMNVCMYVCVYTCMRECVNVCMYVGYVCVYVCISISNFSFECYYQ